MIFFSVSECEIERPPSSEEEEPKSPTEKKEDWTFVNSSISFHPVVPPLGNRAASENYMELHYLTKMSIIYEKTIISSILWRFNDKGSVNVQMCLTNLFDVAFLQMCHTKIQTFRVWPLTVPFINIDIRRLQLLTR